MGKLKLILGALILLLSVQVNAAIITHGNLTSDTTTNFIKDTVTGWQYLRLDAYSLSYADTLSAVGPGGIYEEWTIADEVIADAFIDSLLGAEGPCSGYTGTNSCGFVSDWNDGDFGDSSNVKFDIFAYLDPIVDPLVSIVMIQKLTGEVIQVTPWATTDSLDCVVTPSPCFPFELLLAKEPPCSEFPGGGATEGCFPGPGEFPGQVPAPPAIWLFVTGLIGLIGFSKRRKAA